MAADAPLEGATAQEAVAVETPAAPRQGANPVQLKLDPLESGRGDRGAGTTEQALTREPALREAEARIRNLEQQIKELKGLLAQRDQLPAVRAQDTDVGAATARAGPPQGSPASAFPSTVGGSRGDPASAPVQTVSDRNGDSAAQSARRERPAIFQTTEGMVLAVLLLLALGTGFALLWQVRRSASAGPVVPDSQWPSDLRAARDAINRAAGRDAEIERRSEPERQSELEKAVGGRFTLPKLDFVAGLGSTALAPSQGSGPKEGAGPPQTGCSAIGRDTDSKSPSSGRG
jgi:hypothetical protein